VGKKATNGELSAVLGSQWNPVLTCLRLNQEGKLSGSQKHLGPEAVLQFHLEKDVLS
jgi:hypothetical protein